MDSQQILSFYMGKNTPERKDYIMENLVVPVEEYRCRETPNPKNQTPNNHQAPNFKVQPGRAGLERDVMGQASLTTVFSRPFVCVS